MSKEDLPRFVDLLKAMERATLETMPPELHDEYQALNQNEALTPEEEERLDFLNDQYKPKDNATINAALAQMVAETETLPTGTFAGDVTKASQIAQAEMRKYMSEG
ncbi:MAG: hypothetical protein EOP21_15165 [Hyphomicrobiales bacterium]|nr:MAG: hypothetical protein EOP21_15165 [Hyphomicrobiales bacterium]